jgi:hypothetical protein
MIGPDIIGMLAGLAPDSLLAVIQDRKTVTRQNARASYRALFEPAIPGGVYATRGCDESSKNAIKSWCRVRDLNPRPSVYKTAALPLC